MRRIACDREALHARARDHPHLRLGRVRDRLEVCEIIIVRGTRLGPGRQVLGLYSSTAPALIAFGVRARWLTSADAPAGAAVELADLYARIVLPHVQASHERRTLSDWTYIG